MVVTGRRRNFSYPSSPAALSIKTVLEGAATGRTDEDGNSVAPET
jgi:hypothetical protein